MRSDRRARRWLTATVLAAAATFTMRGVLAAHAMLLSSEPAPSSVLTTSPARIRLVFSEAIDASVSSIRLVGSDSVTRSLTVSGDPHDVDALIAPVPAPIAAGAYRVAWKTISVDGHAVNGSFTFAVRTDSTSAAVMPPPPPESTAPDVIGPTVFGAPMIAALLRGAALAFLIAMTGVLFFVQRAGVSSTRAVAVAKGSSAAAVVLLAAHAVVWMINAAPDHRLAGGWAAAMLGTTTGHLELARMAATLLAVWALLLARRDLLALMFGAIALAVSGGIGHPAAMHPLITIPAKAIHLGAAATWLGGLIWLLTADRSDAAGFVREARRVSSVALVSVVLVVFTGLAQTFNFLVPASNLFHTTYGAIVLAKMAGATILIGFGAYHRYREVPALEAGGGHRLGGSVRAEVTVFVVVVLIGGLLAYVPPSNETMSMPQHQEASR